MDNALGMGCVERIGNVDAERPEELSVSSGLSCDAVIQRHPIQVLHHDE